MWGTRSLTHSSGLIEERREASWRGITVVSSWSWSWSWSWLLCNVKFSWKCPAANFLTWYPNAREHSCIGACIGNSGVDSGDRLRREFPSWSVYQPISILACRCLKRPPLYDSRSHLSSSPDINGRCQNTLKIQGQVNLVSSKSYPSPGYN
jgi:hypothetical protein